MKYAIFKQAFYFDGASLRRTMATFCGPPKEVLKPAKGTRVSGIVSMTLGGCRTHTASAALNVESRRDRAAGASSIREELQAIPA